MAKNDFLARQRQLEQDADSVLFLHRQEGKDTERELIIAKNKEGECRSTRLQFYGPIQHFSYLGRGEQPMKGVDYGTFRPPNQRMTDTNSCPWTRRCPLSVDRGLGHHPMFDRLIREFCLFVVVSSQSKELK